MAADSGAARRYARALFQVALKNNEVDDVASNLALVTQAATQTPALMNILHHPRIPRARKQAIMHEVFGGQVRADVEHFLFLIVEKDRATILPNVAAQFGRLVDEHRREADAEVVSATPLSEAQMSNLKTRLEAQSGYKLRLKSRVDESILGGLVVRVGDKLIDGSVATRLSDLREQLKRAKVTA